MWEFRFETNEKNLESTLSLTNGILLAGSITLPFAWIFDASAFTTSAWAFQVIPIVIVVSGLGLRFAVLKAFDRIYDGHTPK